MKHTKIVLAAILAITLTACSDTTTAKDTPLIDEITSENIITEETTTTTAAAEKETSLSTTATETETEITSEAPAPEEDIYGFDSAINANVLNENSQSPEINAAYLLWQTDDGNTSIYGIETEEIEKVIDPYGNEAERNSRLVIIKHNNIIDRFKCNWYGAYSSTLNVKSLEGQDDILFTSLLSWSGMPTSVTEMALFKLNSNGNYEMFVPDEEKLFADITGRVTVDVDKERNIIILEADGEKCEIENLYTSDPDVSPEDIVFKKDRIYYDTNDNGEIFCTLSYGHGSYISYIANVNARIIFKDGAFTVESISIEALEY